MHGRRIIISCNSIKTYRAPILDQRPKSMLTLITRSNDYLMSESLLMKLNQSKKLTG